MQLFAFSNPAPRLLMQRRQTFNLALCFGVKACRQFNGAKQVQQPGLLAALNVFQQRLRDSILPGSTAAKLVRLFDQFVIEASSSST
jgi:hypothetical protein